MLIITKKSFNTTASHVHTLCVNHSIHTSMSTATYRPLRPLYALNLLTSVNAYITP